MGKLLVIYSLLPGLAKLFGSPIFFALNLPIIFFLLLKKNLAFFKKKNLIAVFFVMVLVVGHFLFTFVSNTEFSISSFFSSLYIWIMPMIGVYLAEIYRKKDCYEAIVKVALIHSCVGFLIYGFFPLPSFLEIYADKLLEGVAFFRMSSVAGSLIFSSIVSCGLNCHLLLMYHRSKAREVMLLDWAILVVLLLSVLLSLQRSAWLAILPGLMLFLFSNRRLSLIAFCLSFPIGFLVIDFVMSNEFYYSRLMSLFSSDYSAVDERFGIWIYGLNQFNENILGLGIGQSGQFAYKAGVSVEHYITDGDYIKIMSEGGVVFLLFYVAIVFRLIYTYLCRLKNEPISSSFSFFIVVGFLIQMIGSNISEYYFVNFLFWMSLGLFLNDRDTSL